MLRFAKFLIIVFASVLYACCFGVIVCTSRFFCCNYIIETLENMQFFSYTIDSCLYRVSLNTCITYTNKEQKFSSHDELSDNLYAFDDSQEHMLQLKEMYQLIDRLNRLDKALILLWLDEVPYEEIGSIMGISRNNVASRLRRAKEKLTNMANS